MKPESEEHDSSLDFTLIDAGLIKSLMACNKPKPVPKKHRKPTKKKTKKGSKKGVKCTPLDRNINATSKQLFEWLKNIKLEVKRENIERSVSPNRDNSTAESSGSAIHTKTSAMSSLDDLEIPDLKYEPETPTSAKIPTVTNTDNTSTDCEINQVSTMNASTDEYSNTDVTESDSDHDNHWDINQTPTRNISPNKHRNTDVESNSDRDHSSHQSDTESYSVDEDTNDDDKVITTPTTKTVVENKQNKFPTKNDGNVDSTENVKQSPIRNKGEDDQQSQIKQPNTDNDDAESTPSDENQIHMEALKSKGRKRKRIHLSDNNSSGETTPPKTKKNVTTGRKSHATSQNSTKGQTRKFKCPNCKQIAFSVQELNIHYRETQEPVKCGSCTKTFATPSGLHKHKYVHQEKLFHCKDCDKKYPFLSQLQSHELTHF